MNTTIGIFVQKTFDWGFFSQWVQKFNFGIVQIYENYSDTMFWQIFRFTEKGVKNGLKMGQNWSKYLSNYLTEAPITSLYNEILFGKSGVAMAT